MSDVMRALVDQVAQAHESCTPLRIVGGGTWLTAGRPCSGDTLPVGEHRGAVEYTPGDLTITVRAGTTLRELHETTAVNGQWLGLDPAAHAGANIGATIATAADGPLSVSMGRVRDLVLGLECITGRGEVIRAGGRVVKNVAGFDLVRLQTGAWGTLGVITEATLRLRALPEEDRTFVVATDQRAALESVLAPLVNLPVAPLAMELVNGALASTLGLPASLCLLVRLGGNSARIGGEQGLLGVLGDVSEVERPVFDALQSCEPLGAMVAQVSHMPTLISTTWRHIVDHCSAHQIWQPMLRASLARGMVRMVIPPDAYAHMDDEALHRFVRLLAPPGAHVSWQQLPTKGWTQVPSSVADRLSVGIRRALDPERILNRGLLGEPDGDAAVHAVRATGASA